MKPSPAKSAVTYHAIYPAANAVWVEGYVLAFNVAGLQFLLNSATDPVAAFAAWQRMNLWLRDQNGNPQWN